MLQGEKKHSRRKAKKNELGIEVVFERKEGKLVVLQGIRQEFWSATGSSKGDQAGEKYWLHTQEEKLWRQSECEAGVNVVSLDAKGVYWGVWWQVCRR